MRERERERRDATHTYSVPVCDLVGSVRCLASVVAQAPGRVEAAAEFKAPRSTARNEEGHRKTHIRH
jgi:hypothetical protein